MYIIEDKEVGVVGIFGLEIEVVFFLDVVNRGFIIVFDIVEKMYDNFVRFFGIKGCDFLLGNEVIFMIIDLKKEWKVKFEEFYIKVKWSLWERKKIEGKGCDDCY